MKNQLIYLDNNATTRVHPEVAAAMLPYVTGECYGNPSASYGFGKKARAAVEQARQQVAYLLAVDAKEIVFTSCGTESNYTAIESALRCYPERRHVVISAGEHSAVENLCLDLERRAYRVTRLGLDGEGLVDLAELESVVNSDDTALVSLIWANNETGVLSPIEDAANIVKNKGVLFHSDAVQAVGKVPLSLADSAVSMLSLSGHKLHAAKGVGVLYVNGRVRFEPILLGGGQENGRRSGTENVAGIVGLGKAAEILRYVLKDEHHQQQMSEMRDRFERTLLDRMPDTLVNGHREKRLPNTSNLCFAGVDAEGLLILLDNAGLCCSPGSACSTGSVKPSRVLTAMGMSAARARSSVRFSLSMFTTEQELDRAVDLIEQAVSKLKIVLPVSGGPVIRHT
ncbi:MAG: cysteine desulfurase [Verrucomicrobiales bacterium]|nr:cysteine desulfurase [Verrucomicrobiales bacterium]